MKNTQRKPKPVVLMPSNTHFSDYFLDNGEKISVIVDNDAVWMTIEQIAQLYDIESSMVVEMIDSLIKERRVKLDRDRKTYSITSNDNDGNEINNTIEVYNIDMTLFMDIKLNSSKGKDICFWSVTVRVADTYPIGSTKYDICQLELKCDELSKRVHALETKIKDQH